MPIITTSNGSILVDSSGKALIQEASPLDLPNLKLYLSATRMLQQTDGTNAPSFIDYSGNNYNATQGNASLQSLFKTNQFGTNAGLKFDGVDDIYTITDTTLLNSITNQFTFQYLAKRSTISSNSQVFAFFSGSAQPIQANMNSLGFINYSITKAGTQYSLQIQSNDLNVHLIQMTLNTNGIVYCYLDGVNVGNFATPVGSINTSIACYIGYNGGTYGSAYLNGCSLSSSFSDTSVIQAQYRGYLSRGYL